MSTKRRAYLTEMKTQLTLAVPALLAQIAMISMGFVDMVMTGRVGAVDMAAVALAGSLWVPLVLFGQGLLLAVTPCVAQLRGAGSMRSGEHMQGVGHVMRQGIWMAPVSYTHLDVYKRQPLDGLGALRRERLLHQDPRGGLRPEDCLLYTSRCV